MWPLLREARAAGIEVLPGEGVTGPVHVVDDAATLVLHVKRAGDGTGDLDLDVVDRRAATGGRPVSGSSSATPCTRVAVEGDDGSLTFVPLDQELDLGPAGPRVGARRPARARRRARPASSAPSCPGCGSGCASGPRCRSRRRRRREVAEAGGGDGARPRRQRRARRGAHRPRPRLRRTPAPLHDGTVRHHGRPRPRRRGRARCGRRRRCARSPGRCAPTSAAIPTSCPGSCSRDCRRPGSSATRSPCSRPTSTSRSRSTASCRPTRR